MKKSLLLIMMAGFLACSKDKDSNSPALCDQYVPGNVVVGIKGDTPIETVFSFFNTRGLKMKNMYGFYYTSPLPEDSVASLQARLMEKPYMNVWGSVNVWPHYQTRVVNITNMFWDMDIASQQDWMQTVQDLHLTDKKGDTKSILLEVPVGKEMAWLDNLKNNGFVTWAELNCIGGFRPFNP